MSLFPLIWRKILVCVELRGVVGDCNRLKSNPSTLLLEGPEARPKKASDGIIWDEVWTGGVSPRLVSSLKYLSGVSENNPTSVSHAWGADDATDLRDGHYSRRRWDWLLSCLVVGETGKMILQHDPPSSANCWGCTTTRDDESARLVGLSRLLCHAVSRPLSGALQASRDFGIPAVFAKIRSTPNVHPTWRHCDVAERHDRSGGVMFWHW
ncbi:hypothetical protein BHM03_00027419 [Ensete ventricosum]|nr:hypothetical protein BHM03_00027419 [Ensete ventricosum]